MEFNFSGFLPVYRTIELTDAIDTPEKDRMWGKIIRQAYFEDTFVKTKNGNLISAKRGQLVVTYQDLTDFYNLKLKPAKRLTRSSIKKLMQWFCDQGMIEIEAFNKYIVITVCKYNTYNKNESQNDVKKTENFLGQTVTQKDTNQDAIGSIVEAKKSQTEGGLNHYVETVCENSETKKSQSRSDSETKNKQTETKKETNQIQTGSPSIEEVISKEVNNSTILKNLNTFRPTSSGQDEFQFQPEIECSLSAMPVDADNDPPAKRKQPRKPRPLFDAIAQVCGFNSSDITESLGKQIGKAERELKGFEIKPEQVLQFPSLWKKWPCKNDPIQPHNLIKHAVAIKQIKSTNPIVSAENDPQHAAKDELRMAQNWLENQLKWVKKNEFNLQKYYSEEERKNISDAIEHKKARIAELQTQLQQGVA